MFATKDSFLYLFGIYENGVLQFLPNKIQGAIKYNGSFEGFKMKR